jgi:hypothetical protein
MKRQSSNLEILHLLLWPRSRLKRSKDRSGTDDIDSNMLRSKLEGEGSSESDDSSLGGGIVDHRGRSLECGDGRSVDDGSSGLHVWDGRPDYQHTCYVTEGGIAEVNDDILGDGEHGEDVTPEGALYVLELIVRHIPRRIGQTHVNVGNVLLHDLLAGVVDQDIQSTVLANVVRDELLAVLGVHDVQSEGNTFLSIGLDGLLDPLGTVDQL